MGSCGSTDAVSTKKALTPSDLHRQELRRRRLALKNANQDDIEAYYEDYYRHDELLGKSSNEESPEPLENSTTIADTSCVCQHCENVRQLRLTSLVHSHPSTPPPEVIWDENVLKRMPSAKSVLYIGGSSVGTPVAPVLSPLGDDVDACSSIGNVDTPLLISGATFQEALKGEEPSLSASGELACRRKQWASARAKTSARLTRKRPPPLALKL